DLHGAIDDFGHECLAEGDRVALENATAGGTTRIVLAPAHPLEHLLHRVALAAGPAHRAPDGAVDFDDAFRRVSGDLVEFIDVLRHQRMQPAARLERHDRLVAPVGPGVPGGAR